MHSQLVMFVTLSCPQTQQNKFVNWQGDAEFRGEDFTATVTLGNPDLLVGSGMFSLYSCRTSNLKMSQQHPKAWSVFCFRNVSDQKKMLSSSTCLVIHHSGIVVAHYLQSMTPALALGGELVYHRRPGDEGSVMSLVGRYTGLLSTWILFRFSLFVRFD